MRKENMNKERPSDALTHTHTHTQKPSNRFMFKAERQIHTDTLYHSDDKALPSVHTLTHMHTHTHAHTHTRTHTHTHTHTCTHTEKTEENATISCK